mgnify:CR=1 FL=1
MEQLMLHEGITPEKMSKLREYHRTLMEYLSDGEWHKQQDITRDIGLRGTTVRCACQHFGGIIGLPQHGYKRMDMADTGEKRHALASLRSRQRKIQNRVDELVDDLMGVTRAA